MQDVKSLKATVLNLWNAGKQSSALNFLEENTNDDNLDDAMDEQQLAYTDDVIMGLVDITRQRADDLDDCSPDTAELHDALREIDEISESAEEQDIPIWDVSLGVDDASTASYEQMSDLIDVITD